MSRSVTLSMTPFLSKSATLSVNRSVKQQRKSSATLSVTRNVPQCKTPSVPSVSLLIVRQLRRRNVTQSMIPSMSSNVKLPQRISAEPSMSNSATQFKSNSATQSMSNSATLSMKRSVTVSKHLMVEVEEVEVYQVIMEVEVLVMAMELPLLLLVDRSLDRNAKMYQGKSATTCLARNVDLCPGKSVGMYLWRSVTTYPDRSPDKIARQFLLRDVNSPRTNSARMCPDRCVVMSRGKSATIHLGSSVGMYQGRSAR